MCSRVGSKAPKFQKRKILIYLTFVAGCGRNPDRDHAALVAPSTQPASYVFTKLQISSDATGIRSPVYSVLLSWLVSQYSLYGYDAAAHLTEETRNADRNGPLAILSSIGMISVFGWAFILALTFSIQVVNSLLSDILSCFLGYCTHRHIRVAFLLYFRSSASLVVMVNRNTEKNLVIKQRVPPAAAAACDVLSLHV